MVTMTWYEGESGAHSWVADKYGIVTNPVGFHSEPGRPPYEGWDGEEDAERPAMMAAAGQLRPSSIRPPAPGRGTVSVWPVDRTTPACEWQAGWSHADEGSDEVRYVDGPEGMPREQAIAWALEQPAARRLVYDEDAEDFRELLAQ